MTVSGSATISIGDTYVDVAHNLGHIPNIDVIVIRSRDDLGGRSYWMSDVGISTFRINMTTQDLADHLFGYIIFDSPLMRWIRCPKCEEITDLHRIGSVGEIRVKANQKLTMTHSKRVKCGFCNTTFLTDGAIIWETFGRDSQPEEQSF